MSLFNKSCSYGIRAMLYLISKSPDDQYVNIREISEDLNLSFHFLTKIFQKLTQNNILDSYRGPNGGVRLARPAEDIYLIEIVHVLEGEDTFKKCMLDLPECADHKPCPVHDFWMTAKEDMRQNFQKTTLGMLVEEDMKNKFIL